MCGAGDQIQGCKHALPLSLPPQPENRQWKTKTTVYNIKSPEIRKHMIDFKIILMFDQFHSKTLSIPVFLLLPKQEIEQ